MVHFAIEVNGTIRPLCGEWGGVPNWTKVRSSVSCPRCLERLRERTQRAAAAEAA